MSARGSTPEDIISYVGCSASRCGYCGGRTTSETFGIWAHALSCSSYKKLMDRGWRRSGHYLYKPNLALTCCMLYTIRLDAAAFRPDKAQRKALNKLNRYVSGDVSQGGNRGKGDFNLSQAVHAAETSPADRSPRAGGKSHTFTVTLVKASCTDEKFELYKAYQVAVHKDEPAKLTKASFSRFLCESPLSSDRIPSAATSTTTTTTTATTTSSSSTVDLPQTYGTYHQEYRIDGVLICVGVLDILPGAVSSVYLFYDPAYDHLSLGRISACREALLTRELSDRTGTEWWYYMGYYIPNCSKMSYKGDYAPSYLADPRTLEWRPLVEYQAVWRDRQNHVNASGDGVAVAVAEVDYYVSFDIDGTSSGRPGLHDRSARTTTTRITHDNNATSISSPPSSHTGAHSDVNHHHSDNDHSNDHSDNDDSDDNEDNDDTDVKFNTIPSLHPPPPAPLTLSHARLYMPSLGGTLSLSALHQLATLQHPVLASHPTLSHRDLVSFYFAELERKLTRLARVLGADLMVGLVLVLE